MTTEEFDKVVGGRLHLIKTILQKKAKEYARGDRLHNFKRAGALLQQTPERVCLGFMMKHVVSVVDIVEDLDRGAVASKDLISEKLGDTINYLILLEAILAERK